MFETALPTNESVNCNRFVDFAACSNEGYLYVYILINSLKFEKKKNLLFFLLASIKPTFQAGGSQPRANWFDRKCCHTC